MPATLSTWLAAHNALATSSEIQPSSNAGVRSLMCTDDSHMQPIEPGASVAFRGSVGVRVPPGPLAHRGAYQLAVAFRGYARPGDYIENPLSDVVARTTVMVTDDPHRADADAAIAAFANDPRLQPWLTSTIVPNRPDLTQSYTTELSWWRRAWELWITPYWQGTRPLRMRYDPAQHKVVDVRTVYFGTAPDDEPGANPIGPHDVIIPPPHL